MHKRMAWLDRISFLAWVVLKCSTKCLWFHSKYGEEKVAAKIEYVMMKRIWRIPVFLLIVIVLGASIVAVVVVCTQRVNPALSIVLGTGHLIDGYHVAYGEDLKATWTAEMFRLSGNGSFTLDVRFDYVSENPTVGKVFYSQDSVSTLEVDFEYVTSIALMRVGSVYEWEPWGDFLHSSVTGIIPIVPKFTDSRSCLFEYRGGFSSDVDVAKVMTQAYGLEFMMSWIRVFRDKNEGTFYYQWLQGNSDVWGGTKLEVDRTYSDLSGGFGVYYPIPESMTSPSSIGFDYVKWIKENA